MVTTVGTNPRVLLAEHLSVLRDYARQALLYDRPLSSFVERDRIKRLREVWAMGKEFRLTESEIVGVLYKDLFVVKRGCTCPTCRQRRGLHGVDEAWIENSPTQ